MRASYASNVIQAFDLMELVQVRMALGDDLEHVIGQIAQPQAGGVLPHAPLEGIDDSSTARLVISAVAARLSSIVDSRGTAFIVHVEGGHMRRRLLSRAVPQATHQRLNPLTAAEFALSILLESRSIAVSF
jgi:hypothetical protein